MATWGSGGKFAPGTYAYTYDYQPGTNIIIGQSWKLVSGGGGGTTTTTPNVPVVTGVSPLETNYSLYGHTIPLSVFGVGRIGGEIIAGPWVANGKASFIISFGVPADPGGSTRTLREIAFDSEVVWDSTNGFSTEAFTYRWYPGTMSQAADPLETTHFGANAVAYRPQMLLAFQDLPLSGTKFGKIPYVAAVIADSSGEDVNLGEAFERLAYSPWVGYTSAQFETSGINDGLVDGGLIISSDIDFLSLIQNFGRFYRTWDILQTDKLRIVDRGSVVTADIGLNRGRLIGDVVIQRSEASTVPRVLELATIDPEQDYTIVPSRAVRPRDPVNVSASVETETAYLPMIMDSATRQSLVTYAKYSEEVSRKKIQFAAMMYGLEIEPGDLVTISGLPDGFRSESFKVTETLHGINHTVEISAEAFLNCEIPTGDEDFSNVVLLMGFEDSDGSQTSPGLTDESLSAHGTASSPNSSQIDTSQAKFGSSSLWINGTSPTVLFGDSDDWTLSSANSDEFTIECWVRLSATPTLSHGVIVAQSLLGVTWDFIITNTGELKFRSTTGGGSFDVDVGTSGAGITTGSWYHLAVDKASTGKIRLYKNGVMFGSATPADSSIASTNGNLTIGAEGIFGGNPVSGWLDELRITKGVARYKSDGGFAVPTTAFPREGV